MQTLIEDYKIKLEEVTSKIKDTPHLYAAVRSSLEAEELCYRTFISELEREKAKGEASYTLIEKAIDDSFNQAHYSFIHPDICPPMEHNLWREKWLKENIREEAKDEWISVNDRMPQHNEAFPKKAVYVLIHMDYSKWGRDEQRIEKASVHYASERQHYGGPNSLTGDGYLTGTYFAIPAILNPECVTHWRPLPELPVRK